MTEFRTHEIPAVATHLMVVTHDQVVVSMIDLAAEQPRSVYVPKGDSLYWADEDGVRTFIDRPGPDQDLSVETVYAPEFFRMDIKRPPAYTTDETVVPDDQSRAGGYQDGGGSMRTSAEIMAEINPKPDRSDWSDRHASTQHIMKYFTFQHLPEGPLQDVSRKFYLLAYDLLQVLGDGPELSAGLRKLLEAKDCCVRAAL